MLNPYQIQSAKIFNIQDIGGNSKLFVLQPSKDFTFQPGQFLEVSLPGWGEAPFSICGGGERGVEIAVRKVGVLTGRLHQLKKGDTIGLRGPFGKGFPIDLAKKRNVLIVVGGCGLMAVRPFIKTVVKEPGRWQKVQIFYGAKTEADLLFRGEYQLWKGATDFQMSLEQGAEQWRAFRCAGGVVTCLFDKVGLVPHPIVFLCGPPVMYKFVLQELEKRGVLAADIYLSLERRMHCGIGVCQHCAIGSKYVCKDGPVFSWEELKIIQEIF